MATAKERIIEGVKTSTKRKVSRTDIKYPDVTVKLIGKDGNAFSIMGEVTRAMRRAGKVDGIDAFMAEATSAESYDAFLRVVMKTVDVR